MLVTWNLIALYLGYAYLYLSTNTGYGAQASALELGDLERRLEHVFDEGRVLKDLVWMSGEFHYKR